MVKRTSDQRNYKGKPEKTTSTHGGSSVTAGGKSEFYTQICHNRWTHAAESAERSGKPIEGGVCASAFLISNSIVNVDGLSVMDY